VTETKLCEIGKRIYDLRKKKNWTQEQLAEKSSLTPQFVSYAESGKREIRIGSLLQIALALDTSCDFILTGFKNERDQSLLSKKISQLSVTELTLVERIIDELVSLYHTD